ncbi:class I SAM-dependent methyltransferase [Flavisolibacter tropicus]|uniref:Methyltransferase n=1 Tax=Flavisolibacter tropicus TaxID=1492898 RepID=A0A172TSL1_9BACT|nr:class I SAM-dependent methyltransferase [Flavisolibacter tropicus]ANE50020.1 hypothetical protein SY85_05430 [Flavisolibacter tropicus]
MEKLRRYLSATSYKYSTFKFLDRQVIEVNDFRELKKLFRWENDPILDRDDMYNCNYVEDLNERKLRDTESIATIMRNAKPKTAVEIGTADGMGTLLLAKNSPDSQIYTVNIPPEEIKQGGKLVTYAPDREEIGSAFKETPFSKNIHQIYANTAYWEPNIGTIDFAIIDGCHDTKFVYNDTKKILKHAKKGSFILWHDFNPSLVKKFNWIHTVCKGVDQLCRDGLITDRIYHIKDSWVGIYRV